MLSASCMWHVGSSVEEVPCMTQGNVGIVELTQQTAEERRMSFDLEAKFLITHIEMFGLLITYDKHNIHDYS